MKIIGLTGGSGTGKGTVAARMRALGAGWVDADAVYRTLCAENREMLSALDTAFGIVTDANGALDRRNLRKSCFPTPQSCKRSTKSPLRISAGRLSTRFTHRASVRSCCTMRRPCLKPVRMTSATKSSLCSRRTTRALPESSSGTVCPTRPRAPHRCAAERHVLPRKMRFYHRKQRRSRYAVSGHRCFIQSTH